MYIRDKKAQIKKRLEHVTVPHKSIPRFASAIELTDSKKEEKLAAEFEIFSAEIVSALHTEEESEVHNEEYLKLLD